MEPTDSEFLGAASESLCAPFRRELLGPTGASSALGPIGASVVLGSTGASSIYGSPPGSSSYAAGGLAAGSRVRTAIQWQEDVIDYDLPNLPLTVRVCTWNLGGSSIDPQDDFGALLIGGLSGSREGPDSTPLIAADICVVGFQEMVELNGRNIFWGSATEEENTQASFEKHIVEELGKSGYKYSKVACVGMVGLFMVVLIKENLYVKVSELALDRVKTGLFHMAGNKGAVCVRFSLEGASFCFLNLHLAAGQEKQAARNQDLEDALKYCFQEVGAFGTARGQNDKFHRESAYGVSEHHLTVVLGDFNFRLELPEELTKNKSGGDAAGKSMPAALEGIPSTAWLEFDPWCAGMVGGMDEFVEGEIEFPPTYKYKKGSNDMDNKRLPAWCDRIFYKVQRSMVPHLIEYNSCMSLKHTSDHRPVVATIEVHNKSRPSELRSAYSKKMQTARKSWFNKSFSVMASRIWDRAGTGRASLVSHAADYESRVVRPSNAGQSTVSGYSVNRLVAPAEPVPPSRRRRCCGRCFAFLCCLPRCLSAAWWKFRRRKDQHLVSLRTDPRARQPVAIATPRSRNASTVSRASSAVSNDDSDDSPRGSGPEGVEMVVRSAPLQAPVARPPLPDHGARPTALPVSRHRSSVTSSGANGRRSRIHREGTVVGNVGEQGQESADEEEEQGDDDPHSEGEAEDAEDCGGMRSEVATRPSNPRASTRWSMTGRTWLKEPGEGNPDPSRSPRE